MLRQKLSVGIVATNCWKVEDGLYATDAKINKWEAL